MANVKLDKKQKAAIADLKHSFEIARDLFPADEIPLAVRLVYETCFFEAGKIDEEAIENLKLAVHVVKDTFAGEGVFEALVHIYDDGEIEEAVVDVLRASADIAKEVFNVKEVTFEQALTVAAQVFEYDPDGEEDEE